MVKITPEAEKFIVELLDKNNKTGYGIKVYLSGHGCSGPQFGMSFQEKEAEGDIVDTSSEAFKIFYDEDTAEPLKDCVIEFVDDPNFGTGLTIRDPNAASGCSSCSGCN